MANRRCLQELSRRATAFLSTSQVRSIPSLPRTPQHLFDPISLRSLALTPTQLRTRQSLWSSPTRLFSSNTNDTEDDEDDEEDEEEEIGEGEEDVDAGPFDLKRDYSPEEKAAEAAAIGYRVVEPLRDSDQRVFKPYEPVFAIVQVGSHQFKVSNRDSIYTERLKFCEVNDKLILNKVLFLGSRNQTIIGRPIVPDAAVHAVVEEHALDAKVLIFKKKRRKNYRRTKGHRQELTKLRITDIQGIEKPEPKFNPKALKAAIAGQEKVEVAA